MESSVATVAGNRNRPSHTMYAACLFFLINGDCCFSGDFEREQSEQRACYCSGITIRLYYRTF